MEILDIHTHHAPDNTNHAIENIVLNDNKRNAVSLQPNHYYSVGYHPWYITPDGQEDWKRLTEIASKPNVLAIGEAGLDKLANTSLSTQEVVFRKQIQLAEELRKPLIIHSVRTLNTMVQLKKELKPAAPWIIHGFRGKKEMAKELIKHGFYLSFGEKYHKEALLSTPIEKMFFETDESKEPIHHIYEQAARILSISTNELIDKIQQNIHNLIISPLFI